MVQLMEAFTAAVSAGTALNFNDDKCVLFVATATGLPLEICRRMS